jgi:hypothetical protein
LVVHWGKEEETGQPNVEKKQHSANEQSLWKKMEDGFISGND